MLQIMMWQLAVMYYLLVAAAASLTAANNKDIDQNITSAQSGIEAGPVLGVLFGGTMISVLNHQGVYNPYPYIQAAVQSAAGTKPAQPPTNPVEKWPRQGPTSKEFLLTGKNSWVIGVQNLCRNRILTVATRYRDGSGVWQTIGWFIVLPGQRMPMARTNHHSWHLFAATASTPYRTLTRHDDVNNCYNFGGFCRVCMMVKKIIPINRPFGSHWIVPLTCS